MSDFAAVVAFSEDRGSVFGVCAGSIVLTVLRISVVGSRAWVGPGHVFPFFGHRVDEPVIICSGFTSFFCLPEFFYFRY